MTNLSIRRPALLLILLVATSCGAGDDPALVVGPARFSANALAGLGSADLALLADLAALGAATAGERLDTLVSPLVGFEVERSRLETLPLHLGAGRLGIGEPELRGAYAADPAWELRVRHVVRLVPRWASPAGRAAARAVAEEVERRARAGEDFAALAAELSEEPGAAARGGLLEAGREGSWVGPFWEAAVALAPGETSPVVETEYGYHVLRLEERTALPFTAAERPRILRGLVPQGVAAAAMEEWIRTRPPVAIDDTAVAEARRAIRGEATVSLAAPGVEGGADAFGARELTLAWMLADPERRPPPSTELQALAAFAETEASRWTWAGDAAELGVPPLPGVGERVRREWVGRLLNAGAALGFSPGMPPERVAPTALAALGLRGQEARIARAELVALRPLLRSAYPPAGEALDSSASSPSSSEMRKSEKTR